MAVSGEAKVDEERFYVPEMHDLHPGMAPLLPELIAAFPPEARAKIAYSVVPNWMGAEPLSAYRDFAAQVAELDGIRVLHGWTHENGRDFLNWFFYGHENRSEFAQLSQGETEDRLDRALEMWQQAGLEWPRWFCAPRWQPNAYLDDALQERAIGGILARGEIRTFGQGGLTMPALNFDEGERGWKVVAGCGLRRFEMARLLRRGRPFRLVLHPGDLANPCAWRQFREMAARLDALGWRARSVEDVVGQAEVPA